jgi:predicted Zn-dependent protease
MPLSLSAAPISVSSDQTITVTFSGAPGNLKDFVALYRTVVGDKEGYVKYQFLQGKTAGTLTFTAPSTTGSYEFRMFLNNTWKKLATSNTVTVSGSATILQASPTTISQGGIISVNYSGAPGNYYDWIGMFEIGAENGKYIYYQYLWGATSGTLSFTAPQNTASTYEFRLFRNNTYLKLATSNPVTVAGLPTINASPTVVRPGDTITVTYSNSPTWSLHNVYIWMDLYSLDDALIYYKDYAQITQSNGTFYFTAPDDPGKYIFRIMDGWTYYATSNTIEVKVDGIATIAASPTQVSPGQTIQVDFSDAPGNLKDFIALYKTGVSDKGGYETYQWLNGQISGTLTFTAPLTIGFYEFRLFQNNTWTKLGTSNTVVVSTIDPDTLGLMRRMTWGGNRVVRWRDGSIGVYNNTSFQDLQSTVLNVWNNVIGGPVQFLESTSTNSPVKIILDPDLVGTQTAGYSDTYWRNYEIYKSEININPDAFEDYPDYLPHMYLHEYGHTIGLAHTSDGGLMDYSSGYDMDEIKDPLKKVVYALYRQPMGNQLAIVLSSEEDLPSEGHIHLEYLLK